MTTDKTTAINATDTASTIAYTDGSCLGNPGPGGWAVVIVRGNDDALEPVKQISGGTADRTTNNVMEMTAAIQAIKALTPIDSPVTIISDSQYVIKGMREWLTGWKNKGWKTAEKKPVKNMALWQELDALNSPMITWSWVRGHAGNRWNEVADTLANAAAAHHSAQMGMA